MSMPERLLWQHLRGSPEGLRFRRQHPAGPYVLDFFCARANLAIKIDGLTHDNAAEHAKDMRRDDWMMAHRIETLRIPASDVFRDVIAVADAIVAVAQERLAQMGKVPQSDAGASGTSPTQVAGETQRNH
jgi:very-short-patch-repair endonuclease